MSSSTSHKQPSGYRREAHGGGGDHSGGGDGEGGGGGGGGDDGRLVKVGFGRTQVEAELLQGFLTEAGVPSVLKRTIGFDAPEFFASGPHDIFVNLRDAPRAQQVLAEIMVESEGDEVAELEEERRLARGETGVTSPGRLAFWVAVAALGAFGVVWILYQLT